MPRICRRPPPIKKDRGAWSAQCATLGARSLKAGHTRFFVGYKKHTLRLWLRRYEPAVLLVPLVSWAAPAHVPEGYLLKGQHPPMLAAAGLASGHRGGRPGLHSATNQKGNPPGMESGGGHKIKSDMTVIEPFDAWDQMSCPQGQPLHWLGL